MVEVVHVDKIQVGIVFLLLFEFFSNGLFPLIIFFAGKNEKCKAIVKLSKVGSGAPGREPLMSESDQKQLMLHYHRKQVIIN